MKKVKLLVNIPEVKPKDVGLSSDYNGRLFKTDDGRVLELFIGMCDGRIVSSTIREVIFYDKS